MEPAGIGDEPLDKKKQVERITLGTNEAGKLANWLQQVEDASVGFLALSKSDVVNFILRGHAAELSGRELAQLRQDHYEPVRHINWIMQRLKSAIASGDAAMVTRLQSEIKKIELSDGLEINDSRLNGPPVELIPKAVQPRRSKKKKAEQEIEAQSAPVNESS